MATAGKVTPLRQEGGAAKKPKTGGRTKKSVDQMLVEARVRNELAPMDDSTDVPATLAAIYLGVSEDTLLELRKPAPERSGGEHGGDGPPFYKVTLPGARGQNQAVMYPLGGLREYKKKRTGVTSHEVAVKSGMLGWVSAREPFFAEPLSTERQARDILIAPAWDFDEPKREELFEALLRGEIRCVWLPPFEAARARWASEARHRSFVKPWLRTMVDEAAAVEAAIEGTGIHEAANEASPAPSA
ncbi:hypothetical protein [Ramlibacter sp.]|uniref:hypothetical protein n=1 Tax=Ramlibacter sp. TaxID=1917967 RepID=UPI003D0D3428